VDRELTHSGCRSKLYRPHSFGERMANPVLWFELCAVVVYQKDCRSAERVQIPSVYRVRRCAGVVQQKAHNVHIQIDRHHCAQFDDYRPSDVFSFELRRSSGSSVSRRRAGCVARCFLIFGLQPIEYFRSFYLMYYLMLKYENMNALGDLLLAGFGWEI
jgi:hypothetical protein